MPPRMLAATWIVACCSLAVVSSVQAETQLPLSIASLKRTDPVDFQLEIEPLLRRNCVPCHRENNDEGGLNLESLATTLKGGDGGPAVVAGNAASSLLLVRATGQEEPLMPPDDNSVGAKPLTPNELGLLELWIQQGAKGGFQKNATSMQWQPVPKSIRSILSMDVSPDGNSVVLGSANRVFVWDIRSQQPSAQLVDPSLPFEEAADVDLIQSVAFSPDGSRIVTGGFQTARIWKRTYLPSPISPARLDDVLSKSFGTIAFNDDRTSIALVNALGEVEIHGLAAESARITLPAFSDPVEHLAWSAATNTLIAADRLGRVSVRDQSSGKQLTRLDTGAPVSQIVISRDGKNMLVRSAESADLYRIEKSKDNQAPALTLVTKKLGGFTNVTSLALLDQPSAIAILGTDNGTVHWLGVPAKSSDLIKTIRTVAHGSSVQALTVDNAGSKLFTGGVHGVCKVWSTADGKLVGTIDRSPDQLVQERTGKRDLARQQAKLKLLQQDARDLETKLKAEDELITKQIEVRDKASKTLTEHQRTLAALKAKTAASQKALDAAITKLAEAKKAVPVATEKESADKASPKQTEQDKAKLEKQRAEQVKQATTLEAKRRKAHESNQTAEQTAADKQLTLEKALVQRENAVVAAQEAKKRVAKLQPQLKEATAIAARRLAVKTKQVEQAASHMKPAGIIDIALNDDSTRIATLHQDGLVRTNQVSDGIPIAAFHLDETKASSKLSFSGNGFVCSGVSSITQTRLQQPRWELQQVIGSLDSDLIDQRVTAIAFDHASQWFALGCGSPSRSGKVKVFSLSTGEALTDFPEVHTDTVLGLAFSPDGKTLASASADNTIQLLDVVGSQVMQSLEGHTGHVLSVAWNDDGKTLASASADQTIRIWDSSSGETSRKIAGFAKEVTAVEFVGTTPQAIAACGNGDVRLFDSRNGKTVRTFRAPDDFIYDATLTPDGTTIFAAGQSGVLHVWNVADGKSIAAPSF